MHQDPLVKSKRITDSSGTVVSSIELDPWGGNTNRTSNGAFQPRWFNGYERDNNGADEAMFRRYNRWWSRFDQADPYDGSYDIRNPQSFNRYAYTNNDPVNFVDPTGLLPGLCGVEFSGSVCTGMPGFWGGGFNVNDRRSILNPSGREIITAAEPRVAVFSFDFAENLRGITVETSMFAVGPQGTFNPFVQQKTKYITQKQLQARTDPQADCIRSVERDKAAALQAVQDKYESGWDISKVGIIAAIGFARGIPVGIGAMAAALVNTGISEMKEFHQTRNKFEAKLNADCGVTSHFNKGETQYRPL